MDRIPAGHSLLENEEQYNLALVEVEALLDAEVQLGTPGGERLVFLSDLIEAYESLHYPVEPPTLNQMTEFLIDQGHTPERAREMAQEIIDWHQSRKGAA